MNKSTPDGLGSIKANREWLNKNLHEKFFHSMSDESGAVEVLERELGQLYSNRRILLADRDDVYIVATLSQPGSIYKALDNLLEREISFAMFAHSSNTIPGLEKALEIHRVDFKRKMDDEVRQVEMKNIPARIRREVKTELTVLYPDYDLKKMARSLGVLWANNEEYVRRSSAARIARVIYAYDGCNVQNGLFYSVEGINENEVRVIFAVANPPQREFLKQTMDVFNRLDLGVNRAYCMSISNGTHPYFIGTYIVRFRSGKALLASDPIFETVKNELYNTQILHTDSVPFRGMVRNKILDGRNASLLNAMTCFCHTSLAHNQPDRFDCDVVEDAFFKNTDMSKTLLELFRLRFEPGVENRANKYEDAFTKTQKKISAYNTGHKHLDEVRRKVYACGLLFVGKTLKTNFYVPEKQALAFRLDPNYLIALGGEFTDDLPKDSPFRVTFFFSRYGFGYHVGFSDIARGGWRTIIAKEPDDLTTAATTLFREIFVLAHTQHLKNKDIYEGGSKMAMVLNASTVRRQSEQHLITWRLYKLQYGIASAFFDIFKTTDGVATDSRVIDYYGHDEPIELGPDENMHDSMVEAVAKMSEKRGYILGNGVISSKKVGINHKEYGVTSTGVVKCAEIAMESLGIDIFTDSFGIKMTGGTNGDVAGNAIRILLDKSPKVQFRLLLDGTCAIVDPSGANHSELRRILLSDDLHAFNPQKLCEGGFILYRSKSKHDGFLDKYLRISKKNGELIEKWVTIDEFSREYATLPFTVEAEIFIPAGGRPETIDGENWSDFLTPKGEPTSKLIIEGANSFITPDARVELQRSGVVILRDASANKCGVISSSYEIIGNLLFDDAEFLRRKDQYVNNVLEILEKRAADETRLILARKRLCPNKLYTDISEEISREINKNYAELYEFFQQNVHLCLRMPYVKAVYAHLPKMVSKSAILKKRLEKLPPKYLCAILAAEIGSSLVYNSDNNCRIEDMVLSHINVIYKR